MIFGLTNEEKKVRKLAVTRRREAAKALRNQTWHYWFAWRPKRLHNGRIAWLEPLGYMQFGSDTHLNVWLIFVPTMTFVEWRFVVRERMGLGGAFE